MRFTIRDILWLTVVAALGVGWVDQRVKLGAAEAKAMRSTDRLEWLIRYLAEREYVVDWDSDPLGWWVVPPVPNADKDAAPAQNLPSD
jgi:hypothetical protein